MVDGDDFDVAVASRRPAAELELTIMKGIETGIECHTDDCIWPTIQSNNFVIG